MGRWKCNAVLSYAEEALEEVPANQRLMPAARTAAAKDFTGWRAPDADTHLFRPGLRLGPLGVDWTTGRRMAGHLEARARRTRAASRCSMDAFWSSSATHSPHELLLVHQFHNRSCPVQHFPHYRGSGTSSNKCFEGAEARRASPDLKAWAATGRTTPS